MEKQLQGSVPSVVLVPLKNKILYGLLAIILILIGVFLLFIGHTTLPSRYGAPPMPVSPPTTYFIAALPLSFATSIILYLIDREKYDSLCKKVSVVGLVLGSIGLVIVGPLLNYFR